MGLSEKSGWGQKFSTLEPPAQILKSLNLFQDITTQLKREWLSGTSFSGDQHTLTLFVLSDK